MDDEIWGELNEGSFIGWLVERWKPDFLCNLLGIDALFLFLPDSQIVKVLTARGWSSSSARGCSPPWTLQTESGFALEELVGNASQQIRNHWTTSEIIIHLSDSCSYSAAPRPRP